MEYCYLCFFRSTDDLPGIPAFGNRGKRALPARATRSQEPEQTPSFSSGISPGKVVNHCSNYLQQMRDLHQLFQCGALTEDKFKEQKELILKQLKKLNAI